MALDERAELAAGITAGPEHADWNIIHAECIIIHQPEVNAALRNLGGRLGARRLLNRTQMKAKNARQSAILQLIGSHQIASQEELKQLLASRGLAVTQATLSRDLRELGIVRVPGASGARYLLPEMVVDEAKPSLDNLLPQLFSRIDGVSELIVLHTLPGGAQPVSEAVDAHGWPEVIGTIAGENTVLIVCRSSDARVELTDRLFRLANPG
jgi:transcriptional regulator of arginine metabolism